MMSSAQECTVKQNQRWHEICAGSGTESTVRHSQRAEEIRQHLDIQYDRYGRTDFSSGLDLDY